MAKRASGEGSVRQRPNGLWEARLTYVDPDGRRRSTSFYGASAEEARAKLDEARGRVRADAPVRDSSLRLADWIERWADTTLEASPRKASTKSGYRCLARKHLSVPPLGATPLERLRKSDVDKLIVSLRRQGLSDQSVRKVYTTLRIVLEDARLDGLIAQSPAELVKRPGVERREAKHLDAGDVTKLLRAAEGMRYRPVLVLIASTAVRRGEALALRWEHVDLAGATLRVAATVNRVDGELVFTEPKSKRSRRTIPLSPAIVALLKAQRAAQAAERLAAANQWTDTGLVFTSELGMPVEPRNILRTIKRAAAAAGLKNVGVHTLRHSAAVAWLEAGVHIKAVADLLGHSSIAITGDLYGHTSDATARAAVDGLTDALGL